MYGSGIGLSARRKGSTAFETRARATFKQVLAASRAMLSRGFEAVIL
jgi:hypothetical protein